MVYPVLHPFVDEDESKKFRSSGNCRKPALAVGSLAGRLECVASPESKHTKNHPQTDEKRGSHISHFCLSTRPALAQTHRLSTIVPKSRLPAHHPQHKFQNVVSWNDIIFAQLMTMWDDSRVIVVSWASYPLYESRRQKTSTQHLDWTAASSTSSGWGGNIKNPNTPWH